MDESEKLLLENLIDSVKRVENAENSVIKACSELKGQVENVEEKVDSHDGFIAGNGKEGAIVRLDRVEQTLKVVKRIGYGILATTLTMVIKIVVEHLTESKEVVEKIAGV